MMPPVLNVGFLLWMCESQTEGAKTNGKKYIKKIHLYERLERIFCYFVHHLHQYEQQNSSAPSKTWAESQLSSSLPDTKHLKMSQTAEITIHMHRGSRDHEFNSFWTPSLCSFINENSGTRTKRCSGSNELLFFQPFRDISNSINHACNDLSISRLYVYSCFIKSMLINLII